ncbi:hypothetical protein HSX10_07965 [Winogradskyella undariae]|uniref:DUF6168 family protein n=1 Tax=Winogradskyella TaxID=286104 RepID=UPI00156B9E7C|nr:MULTISPECIES: DUF6168 family protein [Winogradskyella]NRR91497.1 hypothetical protein [Winogradskyella undariae]QNK76794.1 hypothetical protein H7F37_11760 [Winogradskyella sp. PAMC22761]QXP80616.1 hypothetical protein H0I32_08370 [Winogradskyella sp. HaHa_3_26]
MIKSLMLYTASFAVLFLIIHFSQEFVLNESNNTVRFNLWDTNVFLVVASLLICVHLKLFSTIKSLQPQLGFIYLPTLFIKGGLFFLAFKSSIFSLETLTMVERLSLLVPLLLFLGLEVFFVVKILAQNED